jgi:hypothetical protein
MGFSEMTGNDVDIYIDAASIFRSLLNRINFTIYESTEICSGLINACIHYKCIFNNLGVNTRCFIVASYQGIYNTCKSYCMDYNSDYIKRVQYNQRLLNNIKQNMELLKSLIKYVPGIYLINTESEEFESSAVILHYCNRYNVPSLIVSRDALVAQIPAFYNKGIMLYPDKVFDYSGASDISTLVSQRETKFSEFYYVYKKGVLTDTSKNSISLELIPLVMAMNGYDKRSIKCTFNIKKTLKMIENGIMNGTLLNKHFFNENTINDFLIKPGLADSETALKIQQNYFAFSAKIQELMFSNSPLSSIDPIIDLYDPKSLNEINDKYFRNNPIDLIRL